ncbi:MAG: response regulator transcription factor [Clostridia bacterium]|nr:response regulator transcription factor [Clostridia bacterium]
MNKILIVDDEVEIAELISDVLSDEGFETETCFDGISALNAVKGNSDYSAIILDVMMPNMDGLTLCRSIRDSVSCPIIFVTAKSNTLDMVLGLEMGGDDYIMKPFVVEELVAKVKAHIRRDRRNENSKSSEVLSVGRLKLFKDSYEVTKGDEKIKLSTREFQILEYFMENVGKVLSKEDIFMHIWGSSYGDIGTVAVNIKNLRTKIDPDSLYIKTIWGYGYKLIAPSGDSNEV